MIENKENEPVHGLKKSQNALNSLYKKLYRVNKLI